LLPSQPHRKNAWQDERVFAFADVVRYNLGLTGILLLFSPLLKGRLMPAYKALFILIVVGAVVAFGAFTFVPSLRPGFVKEWYMKAEGYTTAQTPTEALEKYRTAIKKRNYEAALRYTGGDYHEQLKIGGDAAAKLGKAIDDVMYTFKETKNLKNDKVEYALRMLDPFPTEFVVEDVKPDKKDENKAYAIENG
jgi:hypothetical protein